MNPGIEGFLSKLKDPKQEMDLVREGMKISIIETFLRQQDLPVKDVLERLHISPSTYFNRKKKHLLLDSYSTEKLLRVISVITFATNVLGKIEVKAWLFREIPSLDNEVPINLLDTEVGHRLVMQALLQIKYGIYS